MKRSERQKRQFKRGAGIAVIGEGPTEQYYLMSIQGLVPVNIYPKIAKDGIEHLVARVEECIAEGYDKVYCLIDMDNKGNSRQSAAYRKFVKDYSGLKRKNRQTGGETEVIVIENHPCLEIWFYYYFKLTTGNFASYERLNPLKPELRKYLPEYEKRIEFFKKCGGLHQYLTGKGGTIESAISNSSLSMKHHAESATGAYSDMARMLDEILPKKQ